MKPINPRQVPSQGVNAGELGTPWGQMFPGGQQATAAPIVRPVAAPAQVTRPMDAGGATAVGGTSLPPAMPVRRVVPAQPAQPMLNSGVLRKQR